MKVFFAGATAGLAGVAVLAMAGRAEAAAPACSSFPNPVFISGSTAAQPAFQAMAVALGSAVSIIYQNPDSCAGLNDAITGSASSEVAAGIKIQFLDPSNNGKATPCTLATPTPEVPDIGASDVFPSTCQKNLGIGGTTSTGQVEVLGPIQAMEIVAPSMSTAQSISAEAAYVVFGWDATTNVIPQWNVASNIFTRPNTSGTLNMVAEAIGLPPAKWANAAPVPMGTTPPAQQKATTGGVFNAVAGATGAAVNTSIGTVAAAAVITNNAGAVVDGGSGNTVKGLFFQAKGQSCGYLPDSTSTSFDKVNVREGRYAIWGPVHFVVNKDSNGNLTAPHAAAARLVLQYLIATGPTPNQALPGDAGAPITDAQKQALIDAESKPLVGGVVPWCAMHVMRTGEVNPTMSNVVSYQPPEPCGCHFEKVTTGATVSSYCKACPNGNSDCNPEGGTSAYPVCRYGYCEVQ